MPAAGLLSARRVPTFRRNTAPTRPSSGSRHPAAFPGPGTFRRLVPRLARPVRRVGRRLIDRERTAGTEPVEAGWSATDVHWPQRQQLNHTGALGPCHRHAGGEAGVTVDRVDQTGGVVLVWLALGTSVASRSCSAAESRCATDATVRGVGVGTPVPPLMDCPGSTVGPLAGVLPTPAWMANTSPATAAAVAMIPTPRRIRWRRRSPTISSSTPRNGGTGSMIEPSRTFRFRSVTGPPRERVAARPREAVPGRGRSGS